MASFTKNGYRPKVWDDVRGRSGKHLITGKVMPHPKDKTKPFIFQTFGGCVLCYITDGFRKFAVNEIEAV